MLGFLGRVGLHFYSTTSLWTPALLFAAGEPGVWYDPSDLSTMFQNSTGTTPVTAVEQPVGLLLDKSKGLALGAELVTNGDFSSNTWWSTGGGAAISGGALNFTAAVATSGAFRLSFATIGKYYELTFEIISISSGGVQISLGTSVGTNRTSAGVYTQRILCTGNTNLTLYSVGASTTASVDNVSIKEVQGNHASQSTDASRPVLSARVNQLTYSEQFDNAVWTKANLNTTGTPAWVNVQTAPDGTMTADKLIESNTTAQHYVSRVPTVISGLTYTLSFYLRAEERTWAWIEFYSGIPAGTSYVNLSTLAKGTTTGSASAMTVTDAGGGWRRIELPGFVASSTTPAFAVYTSTGNGVNSYFGDGTSGIYIWGADLRVTNVGSNMPVYQRVGAATYGTSTVAGNPDYDTTGFPLFLAFNGVTGSRWMVSSTITPGTDKAQMFAGVRKLVDAGVSDALFILETSTSTDANAGSLALLGSNGFFSPAYKYDFRSGGTSYASAFTQSTNYSAPVTNVVTGLGDISGDSSLLRLNGIQISTNTNNQGTGNFLAYPLYIGARAGNNYYYNGNLYELIVRFGPNLSEATIDQTEVWVGDKTGLNLSFATQQTIFDRFNATVLDRAGATILQRY